MYENLEGFGEDCAIDGKYLDTYANQYKDNRCKDNRAEHDATTSCKTYYMKDGSKKNEWHYGFRAHIICDAKYGLPIKSKVTPKEYRTPEFYFALCLNNDTPVMEDIPESVLTTNFIVSLLNDNSGNIQCFSEPSLEKEAEMTGRGIVKFWQAAIINDGYQIKNIPLNDERVEFFLSIYDKDSSEYEYGFKDHYKRYLRKKNSTPELENHASELAGMMTLAGALSGMNSDSAIDLGTDIMNAATDRQSMLPIHYANRVPTEYSKKYDKEEYLLEVYKKIGIQVLRKADHYYYSVILPKNVSIVQDDYGYCVKDSNGETLLHYYDRVDKQDCETKAFKRLAKKIKKEYPRLRIIISGDALYASKPVIDICKENGWKYIIRFKEGSIPTLYREFETIVDWL